MEFSLEISFNKVVVFAKLMPLPSVSTTLPCVSLKAKISKETVLGASELEEELDDEDETLEELEVEVELDDGLLLELLLEALLLEELEADEELALLFEELLELEVEELDLLEEVLLLVLEKLVVLDVMELFEETLLDELFPLEPVKLQAVAHIAISIKAPNNKLFFFIKNLSQLLNNKITIIAMVNSHIYHDYFTLFLASATVVARLNVVLTFILVH